MRSFKWSGMWLTRSMGQELGTTRFRPVRMPNFLLRLRPISFRLRLGPGKGDQCFAEFVAIAAV